MLLASNWWLGVLRPSPLSSYLFVRSSSRGREMETCAKLANRVLKTDSPAMTEVKRLIREAPRDVISLAQGVVYWQPPEQALNKVKEIAWDPSVSRYGDNEGLPELRQALLEKLRHENKLTKSSVMVTGGANQGFVNLVLTLCDAGDSVVVFAPYYFSFYTAFQMTGVTDILVGPSDPETLQPDADWLEKILTKQNDKPLPKLVNVINPGNPSGSFIPKPLLQRISDLCKRAGVWLIVDNTYEHFMYDGLEHYCLEDSHIINLFTFSKAYGMMGWRVGYIAYPTDFEDFGHHLLKVQDTIPICPSIIGQRLALACLEVGREWVTERVQQLVKNRETLNKALSPLGEGAVKGGEGAIYLWARLPEKFSDDVAVVQWLVKKHGVALVPGSPSGSPGCLRVSFGGQKLADCEVAAQRLKLGLEELLRDGMV